MCPQCVYVFLLIPTLRHTRASSRKKNELSFETNDNVLSDINVFRLYFILLYMYIYVYTHSIHSHAIVPGPYLAHLVYDVYYGIVNVSHTRRKPVKLLFILVVGLFMSAKIDVNKSNNIH